jgi:hypothetical protein
MSSEIYTSRFKPDNSFSTITGLIGRDSIGMVYRIDSSSPDEIMSRGFLASSDFTAVNNMLRGEVHVSDDIDDYDQEKERLRKEQDTLIASTDITGADYYHRIANARGYLYENDATGVSGVSLIDNLINNQSGISAFFDISLDENAEAKGFSREMLYESDDIQSIDVEQSEAHLDLAQLNIAIRENSERVKFIHRY